MWRTLSVCSILVLCAAHAQAQVPVCKVDPSWPTVPNDWIFSAMAGIATDSKDNVWIIHRSAGVTLKKACCKAAPVVMQFDQSGRLLQSWDGPGAGYEWPIPNNEHGIFIDHKDNVWIAGRGATGTSENQILKFDSRGKFLLQIGRRGHGTGSNDTANLGQPADMAVYPPTNEVFVAIDGKFVKEAFVRRASPEAAGTVSSLAFSADQNQQYLYVADQAEDVILVLDRQTFAEVGPCGRLGRQAGQFVSPHNITTDSKGNLYVAEDLGGARLQKFVFAGAGQ
jgi:hypothetical protein